MNTADVPGVANGGTSMGPANLSLRDRPDDLVGLPEEIVRAYRQVCDRCERADPLTPNEADAIRFTDPGETLAFLLGENWEVYAERLTSIPLDHDAGHAYDVLQYQTIILRHTNGAHLATRTCFYSFERALSGPRMIDWRGLTPIQRLNAILGSAINSVYGLGPDGLLISLAAEIDNRRFGSDPTNWVHAARLLMEQEQSNSDSEEAAKMDTALFLASLGHPRFAGLIND